MKTLVQIFVLTLTAWALTGCGGSKSSSNNAGNSTQCFFDPATGGCNNAQYNTYSPYGYQAYPGVNGQQIPGYSMDPNSPFRYQINYYYGNNFGYGQSQLCSCPQGSRPVYNGSIGVGCVAFGALPTYAPVYYWSWSAQASFNNHYVNIPQTSNINPGTLSNGGCFNNVAWSCLVGQANQCPTGSVCTATAQNAPIGVCIRQ